jgi:hypothetical protein
VPFQPEVQLPIPVSKLAFTAERRLVSGGDTDRVPVWPFPEESAAVVDPEASANFHQAVGDIVEIS